MTNMVMSMKKRLRADIEKQTDFIAKSNVIYEHKQSLPNFFTC